MLGRDLKRGTMTTCGLVLEVDTEGTSPFWTKPNYTFIDIQDPYMGPCSSELLLDEDYEIVCEPGTEEYHTVIRSIIKTLVQSSRDRANDARELAKFIQ